MSCKPWGLEALADHVYRSQLDSWRPVHAYCPEPQDIYNTLFIPPWPQRPSVLIKLAVALKSNNAITILE